MPKIKIEVVLADGMVTPAIEAIVQGAKTDQIGDGKVFVTAIDNAIRIRNQGMRGARRLGNREVPRCRQIGCMG